MEDIKLLSPLNIYTNYRDYKRTVLYASGYNDQNSIINNIKIPNNKLLNMTKKYMYQFKSYDEEMIYLINRLFANNKDFLNFIYELDFDIDKIRKMAIFIDLNIYKRSLLNYFISAKDVYGSKFIDRKNDFDLEATINNLIEKLSITREMAIIIINKIVEIFIAYPELMDKNNLNKQKTYSKKI